MPKRSHHRIEMRRLGFLYFEFKKHKITEQQKNVQDMFLRNNFDSLRSSLDEGNLKAGLKQNLLFLKKGQQKLLKLFQCLKAKTKMLQRLIFLLNFWNYGKILYLVSPAQRYL